MKRPRIAIAAASSLAVCVLALAACDRPRSGENQLLRPDDAQVLALGKVVYEKHCAACHGTRLEGQRPNWREPDASGRLPAPPHDASGHTWHHPDQDLFDLTKYGVAKVAGMKDYDSAMPAFEGVLSDAEIIAVLSWIKAQWPPEIRKLQDEVNAAARQKAAAEQRQSR